MNSVRYPLFVKRDLDGFFGLFIDNLVQILLIVSLVNLTDFAEHARPLIVGYILPGVGVSILLGNVFYAWQAHRLARKTSRNDVTALPYGINTPSLLVYVFFVMYPVYNGGVEGGLSGAEAARSAWVMGLIACLGSGMIEFGGAFLAEWIRKHTPRAALLSTLAGIAIGFISMTFALQIFQRPLVAMLPMAIILIMLFARTRFPLGLPGGFVAVVLGTLCAWGLVLLPDNWLTAVGSEATLDTAAVAKEWNTRGWYPPRFVGEEIWLVLKEPKQWAAFLSVIVPMGLFNVLGSLQNIESAEAAGDRYNTTSSLAVNGIGTIAAACFGSCFPTTIYIGHPGWKTLGARAGYSTLNGLVITAICLTGTVGVIAQFVPLEAGIAIVLWIGIIITAQAFQTTPTDHAPAVAIGLFPAIAAWGAIVMQGAFFKSGGRTMQDVLQSDFADEVNGFLIHGMITLERGYIFTCMILAAVGAVLVERRFFTAAVWALIGAVFAGLGLTHAYQLNGNSFDFLLAFTESSEGALAYRPWNIAIGYLLFAITLVIFGWFSRRQNSD